MIVSVRGCWWNEALLSNVEKISNVFELGIV